MILRILGMGQAPHTTRPGNGQVKRVTGKAYDNATGLRNNTTLQQTYRYGNNK